MMYLFNLTLSGLMRVAFYATAVLHKSFTGSQSVRVSMPNLLPRVPHAETPDAAHEDTQHGETSHV